MKLNNQGMTNSAMFNDKGNFNVEGCFDNRADFINRSKSEMRHMYDNNASQEEIDAYAINMAEEFKTILETALSYKK